MKSILAGSAAATIALMVWGMIFWGFLYEPVGVFMDDSVDDAVVDGLVSANTATGTYFFPWPRNTEETQARWLSRHRSGPFFKMSYVREGADPQAPVKFLWGFLHHLVTCLLAALILVIAGRALGTFAKRFLVVFLAGSIGSVYIQLGDPIWFHLPWDYARGALVYELVSWAILGLVLGAFVKTAPTA